MTTDLNQHFIESGELPTNFVSKYDIKHYPKIEKLRQLKTEAIDNCRLHEPFQIPANLQILDLKNTLQTEFETILVDPPWYEYYARLGGFAAACSHNETTEPWWSFEQIRELKIEEIAATPGFCFIWCGNKHVEQATACLIKWGFRRIEDICWLKTNNEKTIGIPDYLPYGALNVFKNSKEHLLVGIRGNVQRSRDSHLMHANIDSDVVIAPQEISFGCTRKPTEVYDIIERFCNSQRRLELFGQDHNLRPGWVTIGAGLSGENNYDPDAYRTLTEKNRYVPSNHEIERLRPKSPQSR